MPIDRFFIRLRAAIFTGDKRKCGAGAHKQGGCTSGRKSPDHLSSAMKVAASPGATPPFAAPHRCCVERTIPAICFWKLIPRLTLRKCSGGWTMMAFSNSATACLALPLELTINQMQRDPGWAAIGAGDFTFTSCTRFSPNTRWPASMTANGRGVERFRHHDERHTDHTLAARFLPRAR